jgi:SWI/SNF-related matrix-associated actin-dependent regulator 1 of chromatin subfamily A
MGLGKSFQTISFLYGLFFTKQIDRVLMLMPVSVLQNWVKEFDKWCSKGPRAPTVHVFHGLNTEKQRKKMISAVKEKGGVLLTSYGTLVSQIELFSADDLSFDYIILDEGHKIVSLITHH